MAKSESEQLAGLKAKLLAIIDEYKVVSKEKNKVFGKAATPNPIEFFYYEIVDSDFKEVEKGQKWTAKRTITKKSATAQVAKNVYKNVYTSALVGGQPKTLNGEGDLPNSAKSRSGRNFVHLIPKMKGGTLVVDLEWDSKPSDDEVQRALEIITSTNPVTSIDIGSVNPDGSLYMPVLNLKLAQSVEFLRTAIRAILVLKRAGYKSFSVNLTWIKPLKHSKFTQTNFDTVVNKACSEYIRGLILYSEGQLRATDFQINAQAIFSQDDNSSFISNVVPQK